MYRIKLLISVLGRQLLMYILDVVVEIRSTKQKVKHIHQENMSVKCILPQTPLLYSKTGVYRGLPNFLIFDPKHRLWVLVRTATILVLSKK